MSILVSLSLLFSAIFCAFADHELLLITQDSIKKYDTTTNKITMPINDEYTPFSHLNDVDFDSELQLMFYLIDMKNIYAHNLITNEQKLILKTEHEILHIAVDWLSKNIYLLVSDRKRVIVCSYDGAIQKVLFQRRTSELRALVVSPQYGYLFISDIGYNARIERTDLDGSNSVKLVTKDITGPVALTIDPHKPVIYWIDAFKKKVEMIHMDGTNRKVLLKLSDLKWGMVSALALVQSKMYFMRNPDPTAEEQLDSGIIVCSKRNDTLANCTTVVKSKNQYASIRVHGKEYQPWKNTGCSSKNSSCSHLCLLKPTGFSCACPTGYKLNDNNRTCSTSFKKFIVLATKPDLRIISLDVNDKFDMKLPIETTRSVRAVDYDPVDKMVYWIQISTDGEFGVIKRATLDGKVIEEVVSQGYTYPDHLAIDWMARNLYWTCSKFSKIYISRLDGSSNMVVIKDDLQKPRGIAVDPGDGRLYWSDWGETKQKIESSDLDGSKRKVLVDHDLHWPNGIALDYHNRQLFWVDAGTKRVEFYDLNKNTRNRILTDASPHPFGVSVLDGMVYWTDWQNRQLYQFDKESGKKGRLVDDVPDIMGIKAVDTTLRYGQNDCGNNNYGCSHFCFHKPNHGAYCACPASYDLSSDRKICQAVSGYLLSATRTSIRAVSLNLNNQSSTSKVEDRDISHIETLTKTSHVYWVEDSGDGRRASAIKRASLVKGGNTKEIVQTGFSGELGGIAIDWLAENIYWSQSKLHRIEVSRLNGQYKRILFSDQSSDQSRNQSRITQIAVDPLNRRLYWFEEHTKAERLIGSDLSGAGLRILENVTADVLGLAVDSNNSRVYWMLDTGLHSMTWDGRDKVVFPVTLQFPRGMMLFQNKFYICEQENRHSVGLTISVVDSISKTKTVVHRSSEWCRDLTVFHSSLQQGDNQCAENNGGCEQLCFATSLINRSCACETHYSLDTRDNSSCIAPTSYLLIGQKESVFRYLPKEQTNLALNLKSTTTIGMLAYNILANTVYWLETNVKNTIKYLYNNIAQTLDLKKPDARPLSFTIDFFSNLLFWTDERDRSVSFINLEDSTRYGVVFARSDYKPTKILSLPEKGLLIFVNQMPDLSTKLESITMDGNDLRTLHVFEESGTDCDISIDHVNERLYWLHLGVKKIKSINLQGHDEQLLMQFDRENFKPLTIAVFDNFIYWIDKKQRDSRIEYLKWRDIRKQKNKIYASTWEYAGSQDLHVVQTKRLLANHPCKNQNGGCSHVCFYTGEIKDVAQCGCPLDYGFIDKKRTQCQKKNNDTCANICNGGCLTSTVSCDKMENCREMPKVSSCLCLSGKSHMCIDGACLIRIKDFCDGREDCVNGIDEDMSHCTKNTKKPLTPSSTSLRVTDGIGNKPNSTVNYSHSIAGIVSGVILTILVFTCFVYIGCRLRQKKVALQKEEAKSFLQHTKFNTATESVFVLTPKTAERPMAASAYIPETSQYPIRYIPGSSTNMTDSTVLPCNPPPTIASLNDSLPSVNEYPHEDDDVASVEILAPPSTPFYVPSDVESVFTNDLDSSVHSRNSKITSADRAKLMSCHDCRRSRKQNYSYKDFYPRRGSQSFQSSTISSNYTQDVLSRRPLYAKSTCNSDCTCVSNKTFHSAMSYHPPSLASEGTTYSNNTLPRMHHGGERRLVPSLASDLSRCSSETSVITVRQRNYKSSGDSSYYAPPPSPGLEEYTEGELNDFKDFKDEEEEAIENDLLIESHRPQHDEIF